MRSGAAFAEGRPVMTETRSFRWGAACASFFAPGLGQVLRGREQRALVVVLLVAFCTWMLRQLLPFLPPAKASLELFFILELSLFVLAALDAGRLQFGERARWTAIGKFLLAACLVVLSQRYLPGVGRSFYVPSGSMLPTLAIDDFLAVDCLRPLLRNEVVVFRRGDLYYVKRVVALAGDKVEIRGGHLLLNGAIEHDPFGTIEGDFASMVVPPGTFFVLGDNRNNSHDSRYTGPIALSSYVGTACWIFWSLDWNRVGQSLLPGTQAIR
jgi:signal peptidase I